MPSHAETRHGRRVRRNHSGNKKHFQDTARWLNKRFRSRTRQVLHRIHAGDPRAHEQFPRYHRYTADWEAY